MPGQQILPEVSSARTQKGNNPVFILKNETTVGEDTLGHRLRHTILIETRPVVRNIRKLLCAM